MKSLDNYSDEELKEELRLRDQKRRIPPSMIMNVDWGKVLVYAKERKDAVERGSFIGDDDEHYMFEAVMEAVYGENYFEWENEWII